MKNDERLSSEAGEKRAAGTNRFLAMSCLLFKIEKPNMQPGLVLGGKVNFLRENSLDGGLSYDEKDHEKRLAEEFSLVERRKKKWKRIGT